jgi:hypothetical protein
MPDPEDLMRRFKSLPTEAVSRYRDAARKTLSPDVVDDVVRLIDADLALRALEAVARRL